MEVLDALDAQIEHWLESVACRLFRKNNGASNFLKRDSYFTSLTNGGP
jgi:hypothetical protein